MSLRRKLLCIVVALLVIATLAVIAWKGPAAPDGRYTTDPNIAIEGDSWWELSNGQVEIVGGGTRTYFGRYTNVDGNWFWIDDRDRRKTNTFRIDSTWWRLRMVDDSTGASETFGFRRVW